MFAFACYDCNFRAANCYSDLLNAFQRSIYEFLNEKNRNARISNNNENTSNLDCIETVPNFIRKRFYIKLLENLDNYCPKVLRSEKQHSVVMSENETDSSESSETSDSEMVRNETKKEKSFAKESDDDELDITDD